MHSDEKHFLLMVTTRSYYVQVWSNTTSITNTNTLTLQKVTGEVPSMGQSLDTISHGIPRSSMSQTNHHPQTLRGPCPLSTSASPPPSESS